jgi:hypothetical protein
MALFGRVAIPDWHKSATRAPSAVQAAATQLWCEDSSLAGKTTRLSGHRFPPRRRYSTVAPSGTSGFKEETAPGWHHLPGSKWEDHLRQRGGHAGYFRDAAGRFAVPEARGIFPAYLRRDDLLRYQFTTGARGRVPSRPINFMTEARTWYARDPDANCSPEIARTASS